MSDDRAMDDNIAQRVYGNPVARWFVTGAMPDSKSSSVSSSAPC
jgi:hypothetical protein